MGKGTFYGLSMKTPVIYAEIQVLLMYAELGMGMSIEKLVCGVALLFCASLEFPWEKSVPYCA